MTHQQCGFKSLTVEPELEVKHNARGLMAMLAKHVDDVHITAETKAEVIKVQKELEKVFGPMEIRRASLGTYLT